MKAIIALSACAVLATSAASAAFAQSVAQPDFYKGDIAAFHGDSQTLINAIHMLHGINGARVVDIRFARENGLPGYHVVLQQDGRFTFMHIDEQSGQVVALTSTSAPDWMLHWQNRADIRFDRRAKVSLPEAIRTAEAAYNNAPAIAAGIATSASNPSSDVHAYNVILDMGGHAKRVAVDSANGEIITDPSALTWD